MWKIGNVEIENRVVLAPMAGISNPSYMKICQEMKVGYAVTELISAEAVVRHNKKTLEMLNGIDSLDIPVAVQIFGCEPKVMAKAAKMLTELYRIAFIDINMGCPVPKVAVRAKSGSALLRDPEKIKEIVEAVVDAVSVPVTVKIRSGWDQNSINAVSVAKLCEKSGASAICVHPRTRSQGYTGKADWNIIREIKKSVRIPVIGNGDILSIYDAKRMIEETSCDAVMIGRGVLGNPWLIKEIYEYLENGIVIEKPKNIEKVDMCLKHLQYLREFKDEKTAVLEIRSHIAWYLRGMKSSNEIKNKIFLTKNINDIIRILEDYGEYMKENDS